MINIIREKIFIFILLILLIIFIVNMSLYIKFFQIGVDSDQVIAAIKATEKMLNFMKREKNE